MTTPTDDLLSRISRIHAVLGAMVERDLSKIRPQRFPSKFGGEATLVDFSGGMSKEEILNVLWCAVHNTSIVYDYARRWADENNVPRSQVAEVSEKCVAVRIIRDLDNGEKHPTANPCTAGFPPRLTNPARFGAFVLTPGSALLTVTADGGVQGPPVSHLQIDADVVNAETGERVADLTDVLSSALSAWEDFLRGRGVLNT